MELDGFRTVRLADACRWNTSRILTEKATEEIGKSRNARLPGYGGIVLGGKGDKNGEGEIREKPA